MKKASRFLAVFIFVFLFINQGNAWAAAYYKPRNIELHLNGNVITNNGYVQIEPNHTLVFDVFAADDNGDDLLDELDFDKIVTSGDDTVVARFKQEMENQDAGSGSINFFYSPSGWRAPDWTAKMGTLTMTALGIVDGPVAVQIQYDVIGNSGTPNVGPFYTESITFRVGADSGGSTLYYLFVPKSISIRDSNGKKVSNIEMTASRSRTFEAWADDYNGDNLWDLNDYDVFPVNDLVMTPTVESESESDLMGTSTTPTLLGLTPTMERYPTKIAMVNITARNPGGEQGSTYDPVYTDFTYQITFDGTTGSGIDVNEVLPNSGVIQTPRVSVRINALDDAGSGDDSGGTCNALGLGALALLVPLAFARRKSE